MTIVPESEDEYWERVNAPGGLKAWANAALADPASHAGVLCDLSGTDWRPCWPLLIDPLTTIRDEEKAPNHVCGDVLDLLILAWRRRYGAKMLGDPEAEVLQDLFPQGVPFRGIGRKNLVSSWRELKRQGKQYRRVDLERLAIVQGEAVLQIPLHTVVNDTSIDFFGLIRVGEIRHDQSDPSEGVGLSVTPLAPHFVIEGDPLDVQARAAMEDLRRWWATHAEFLLKSLPGRPKGTGKELSYDFAMDVRRQMIEDDENGEWIYKNREPFDREFLDYLRSKHGISMHPDTFRKIRKQAPDWKGKTW